MWFFDCVVKRDEATLRPLARYNGLDIKALRAVCIHHPYSGNRQATICLRSRSDIALLSVASFYNMLYYALERSLAAAGEIY